MSNRRAFFRGLVTLPLVGGGVTLIGRPAKAVPLIQAVAAPDLLVDPKQRARYAWAAFAAAMRDVTVGHDAWHVMGGQTVTTVGYMAAEQPRVRIRSIDYVPMGGSISGLVDETAAELYLS